MLTHCILLLAAILVPLIGAGVEPPPPNPADPVDYIAWMDETYGTPESMEVFRQYERVWEDIEPFEGDWGDALEGPWSGNPALEQWLKDHRRALMRFERMTRKGPCYIPLKRAGDPTDPRMHSLCFVAELPQLRPHRTSCKALIAQGFRAWETGNRDELPKNAIAVVRAGRQLEPSRVLITRLVGISCSAIGYASLRTGLGLSEDRTAYATRVLPQLAEADPPWSGFEDLVLAERLSALDLCQRFFVLDEDGNWSVHPPAIDQLSRTLGTENDRGIAMIGLSFGYESTMRDFNACYDLIERRTTGPYPRALERSEKIKDQIGQITKGNRNLLVSTLVPSLWRAYQLCEKIEADRRATHLLLHIFDHHARQGAWPASLDELDMADLEQIRMDPFSGEDFRYLVEGDGVRLYSVAADANDDGGRHDPKWEDGDYVYWPIQRK